MLMFGGISELFISVGIWLVTGLYKVANFAFEIFIILATGNLIEAEDYELMVENFYIVIGVVMLFVLAFALLKGMVNPDDQKKGTETVKKVIINLISSGIILVLLPTIFAFAFDFQDSIISYNSIGKFFGYGSQDSTSGAVGQVKEGAYAIVNGVFTAFLNINAEECNNYISSNNIMVESAKEKLIECQKAQTSEDDETLYDVITYVDKNGTYSKYVGFAENIDDSEMDFDFLLAVVAGALLIYVGVSFCFDMAVRLVKLVFYQLIAPIPLFMRVVPNSKFSDVFSKWTKVTLTCYLEVYIRILVFYFCIYLCQAMLDSKFLSETAYGYGWFIGLLTKAFVLMGIITFMRQAPKLFQEVTGLDSGNMKLGIKDKLKDGGFFAATNAIGGLVAGRGNPLAAVRGLKYGWKNADSRGIGQEVIRHQQYKDALDAGASRRQILLDSFLKNTFGVPTSAERSSRKIDEQQETATNRTGYDINVKDSDGNLVMKIKSGSEVKLDKSTMEALEAQKASNTAAISAASDEIRALDKKIAYGESQIKFKSGIKGEAEKKIDEEGSKIKKTVSYTAAYKWSNLVGSDGKNYISDGTHTFNESDFQVGKEVSIDGKNYKISDIDVNTGFAYYTDANGKKQLIGKESEFTGSFAQIKEFINNDLSPELRQQDALDLNTIRDDMIKGYVAGELSSANDNKVKQLMRSGFNTIINNGGYEYLSYAADGSEQKGKITISLDQNGNYTVSDVLRDANGNMIRDRVLSDYLDEYGIIDELDKIAKSSNGVLADMKQSIDEKQIDTYRGQNEAIDNLKKQFDELKEAKRKSDEQRAKEASKTYIGNRNNK